MTKATQNNDVYTPRFSRLAAMCLCAACTRMVSRVTPTTCTEQKEQAASVNRQSNSSSCQRRHGRYGVRDDLWFAQNHHSSIRSTTFLKVHWRQHSFLNLVLPLFPNHGTAGAARPGHGSVVAQVQGVLLGHKKVGQTVRRTSVLGICRQPCKVQRA